MQQPLYVHRFQDYELRLLDWRREIFRPYQALYLGAIPLERLNAPSIVKTIGTKVII
jgi:hypothetical protein